MSLTLIDSTEPKRGAPTSYRARARRLSNDEAPSGRFRSYLCGVVGLVASSSTIGSAISGPFRMCRYWSRFCRRYSSSACTSAIGIAGSHTYSCVLGFCRRKRSGSVW